MRASKKLLLGLLGGEANTNIADQLRELGLLVIDPAESMLDGSGNPATVGEGVATLENLSTHPDAASAATQGTAARQPTALPLINGQGYLWMPGINGNYASIGGSGASVAGDFTITFRGLVTKSNGFYFGGTSDASNIGSSRILVTGDDEVYGVGLVGEPLIAPVTANVHSEFTFVRTGTTLEFRQDGVLLLSTTCDALAHDLDWIGWYGGTTGILPYRGAISYVKIESATGTDAEVDFAAPAIADGATSFVCDTGQTVTIESTGSNPARIIRHAGAIFDGVDDALDGTFTATLTGLRSWTVFDIFGFGSNGFDRIFTTAGTGLADSASGSLIVSYNQTAQDLGSFARPEAGVLGFPSGYAGSIIHEVDAVGTSVRAWRNGVAAADNPEVADPFSLDDYAFAGLIGAVGRNANIRLLYHATAPPSVVDDVLASKITTHLNNRFALY